MVELIGFSFFFLVTYGFLFLRADLFDRLVVGAMVWAAVGVTVLAVQGKPSHAPVPYDAILIDEVGPFVWAAVDGEPATYLAPDMSEKLRQARANHPGTGAFVRADNTKSRAGDSNFGKPDDLVPFEPQDMSKQ